MGKFDERKRLRELVERERENCLKGGETKPFFLILGFHGMNKNIDSNKNMPSLGPIKTCRHLSDNLHWPRNIFNQWCNTLLPNKYKKKKK